MKKVEAAPLISFRHYYYKNGKMKTLHCSKVICKESDHALRLHFAVATSRVVSNKLNCNCMMISYQEYDRRS